MVQVSGQSSGWRVRETATFSVTDAYNAAPTTDAMQALEAGAIPDSTPEPTPSSPGFGALFALLAIPCAAVCMFLWRRI
jgi:hypothetical protein